MSQRKQRHRARCLAMQALYQWYYNHGSAHELIADLLAEQGAKKLDQEYFTILVEGTLNRVDQIDTLLAPLLDRQLTELNPVELAILRISSYEMLERIDIPYRVVINEGVELAKKFGSEQGHKYINAILDQLKKQCRKIEIKD